MKSPTDLRARAGTRYERSWREWAVSREPVQPVEFPLDPPTEQQLLAGDWEKARGWTRAWAAVAADAGPGVTVLWASRRWPSAGTQTLPDRLVLADPAAVARFTGRAAHWTAAARAVARFRAEWPASASALDPAVRAVLSDLVKLSAADLDRTVAVLHWLETHDTSGLWARQLPVRGVDTKWAERHKRLVNRLRNALGGTEDFAPLLEPPAYRRVRFLDPALRPAGIMDLALPDPELVRLPLTPERVLVVENLQTLLCLPELPGTVAVHGSGYDPGDLARIPWLRAARVQYWGDLDSHGFAILHRFRAAGVNASSVLMDADTLEAHRDLCGSEDVPARGDMALLTEDERAALQLLRAAGDLRLEQERIPWRHALPRLEEAA